MADPVLATPALPAGFITNLLDRSLGAASTFNQAVLTAAAAIVWAPPAFQRANFAASGYPANPTLATPALPVGIRHFYLYATVTDATFKAAVVTAQNAVVWTAPKYPHSNYGTYP